MGLPALDGFDVAARLQSDPTTAGVPIVFLSARTAETDIRRARDLGAIGYFTKPFEPLLLTKKLADMLRRLEQGELEALRDEFGAGSGRA